MRPCVGLRRPSCRASRNKPIRKQLPSLLALIASDQVIKSRGVMVWTWKQQKKHVLWLYLTITTSHTPTPNTSEAQHGSFFYPCGLHLCDLDLNLWWQQRCFHAEHVVKWWPLVLTVRAHIQSVTGFIPLEKREDWQWSKSSTFMWEKQRTQSVIYTKEFCTDEVHLVLALLKVGETLFPFTSVRRTKRAPLRSLLIAAICRRGSMSWKRGQHVASLCLDMSEDVYNLKLSLFNIPTTDSMGLLKGQCWVFLNQ